MEIISIRCSLVDRLKNSRKDCVDWLATISYWFSCKWEKPLDIQTNKVFSFQIPKSKNFYLTTHFLNEVLGGSVLDESINKSINCLHNKSISLEFDEEKIDWLYIFHFHFDNFQRERDSFTWRMISMTFSSPFPLKGIGEERFFFERKDIFLFSVNNLQIFHQNKQSFY